MFSQPDIEAEPSGRPRLERRWYANQTIEQREPLWLRPSSATSGDYKVESVETVGTRVALKGNVDMTSLGSAVHNSIAFCLTSTTATVEEVATIATRWRVGGAVEAQAVVNQARSLVEWVRGKWPTATLHVEVPLEVGLKSGRVVRGQIDLLVDAGEGWVIIDHKSDPRSTGQDDRLAQEHGPQLDAYAQAVVAATGRAVLERWLFLPVAGQVAKVGSAAQVATAS